MTYRMFLAPLSSVHFLQDLGGVRLVSLHRSMRIQSKIVRNILCMDSTLLLISFSRSYDYAVGNKFGATVRDKNTHYNAVLVCNIAPDRKYDAYTSSTFPPGFILWASWEREN